MACAAPVKADNTCTDLDLLSSLTSRMSHLTVDHGSGRPPLSPPVPGLLKCDLTVNSASLTREQNAQAKRKLNRKLSLLQRDYRDRPIRHAVRNFIGLLYYCTRKKDKAIGCWEETVREDPTNLNAIHDLATAYRFLKQYKKSKEWEKSLQDVTQKLQDDLSERQMVHARCWAEQAYAALWDIHTSTWRGHQNMKKKVELYETALQYAGSCISKEEKEDWHLGIGQAYERMAHMYFRSGSIEHQRYLCSMDKAVEHLHFCLSSADHPLHKMEAWGVMGNALTRDKRFHPSSVPRFIAAHYLAEWEDPSLCYERALELDPSNPWIKGCYGNLYMKYERFDDALNILNEAIESNASSDSWFAYDRRARVYHCLAKKTDDPNLKKEYLRKAQRDSSKAGNFNPNPRTLSACGEINHSLVPTRTTDDKKNSTFTTALAMFAESFEIQDGRSVSDAHLKQGKCLLEQDRWSAIQSFKMAFSTSTYDNDFHRNLASRYILPNMLEEYKSQGTPSNLCAEMAFWVTETESQHKAAEVFSILGKLARKREYQKEVLDIMEYLVNKPSKHHDTDALIQRGLETLKETRYQRSNYQRLCELQRRHRRGVNKTQPDSPLPDHNAPQTAKNSDHTYDFFVITADADTPWVQYKLLPALECSLYSLKGYFAMRDTPLGKLPLKHLSQAIKDSAHVLIVLTPALKGHMRSQHLIEIALRGKDKRKVAILLLEDTGIPHQISHLKKFNFCGTDLTTPHWFNLAKFLLPSDEEALQLMNSG
ncbi:tetratricopeptide repeat protein 22-like [Diadema antillarum]|uniref:tetratricopeptide repeat protein 22-like n=1 Tax=Diadema antillarum TaxID=105358 RepID=UPI003A85EC58